MSNRRFVGSAVGLLLVLALLLAYLAKTQWDWLRRLEDYEHVRLVGSLRRSTWYLKSAFDREIQNLAASLSVHGGRRSDLAEQLGEGLRAWRASSRWPALLEEVYLVSELEAVSPLLERFDPGSSKLWPASWSPALEALRQEVALRDRTAGRPDLRPAATDRRYAAALVVVTEVPAILVETRLLADEPANGLAPAWLALRIDEAYLRQIFFPELRLMFFSPPNYDGVDIAVVERRSGDLVYSNLPIDSLDEFGRSDYTIGLVNAGTDGEELPRIGMQSARGQEAYPNTARPPTAADHDWFRGLWAYTGHSGYWHFYIRHGAVSVSEAVAAERRRTLWISLGALALVSIAAVLIFLLARRAQRLAGEQMEFVASVTHELRTPLAILSAAGENLEDALLSDEAKLRQYGRLIQDEAQRLREMVENVLHLARHRSGVTPLVKQPVDLTELIRDAVRRVRRQAEQAGFEVELDLPPREVKVLGNGRALQSAVSNLLSNALKYGQPGRWLRVAVRDGEEGAREPRVSVEDRGPGIESADRGRLFEPFYRGRRARTDQVEGSGLGLAVVRQVVEAHGGRVSVESAPGQGSRFTLHLPALEALPAQEALPLEEMA